MATFVRFVLGVAAGSFLNVLILRYNPSANLFGKQLTGRSHCPRCGKQLRWFELIPLVSFFIQRGKCRRCGESISFQYPLVELAAGLIVAFVPLLVRDTYLALGPASPLAMSAVSSAWALIFLIWLTVAVIDIRERLIPDELNIAAAALGLMLIVFLYTAPESLRNVSFIREYALLVLPAGGVALNHVLGAVCGGASLAALALVTRGKGMGWGDVKLAAAGGLILGLPDILLSLFVAFLAGGVFGGALIALGRRKWKDEVPFGPFIAFGMAMTVCFGYRIVQAYFSLL